MMNPPKPERVFKAIWARAQNQPCLETLTPDLVASWAIEAGISNPSVTLKNVGAFETTPCVVLDAEGVRACFPRLLPDADPAWKARKDARDHDAILWDRVEWFAPLWIPMGKAREILRAVETCSRERAIELFDYHTSTLYTLPFLAWCVAQIMPQARSLNEIVPLAREAYLAAYSGYWSAGIAALIPAMEGSLTRIVSDLSPSANTPEKIDHAINRAIATAADLHFDGMWVPPEYKTSEYLIGQDERVFAFDSFGRWLKNHFFCNTAHYRGVTWLNRHMFAHGTASSWQKPGNLSRLIIALTTLAAIESWYDASHQVSFLATAMDEDSKLLWQQAMLQINAQASLKLLEQEVYHKHGRLVPTMPTDDGVTLRKAVLSQECMSDLVQPLRNAGWTIDVGEPDDQALCIIVTAHHGENRLTVALLYSCATDNALYRNLAETCDAILYRGAPYHQKSYAHDITVHVGPVLGWQPPRVG